MFYVGRTWVVLKTDNGEILLAGKTQFLWRSQQEIAACLGFTGYLAKKVSGPHIAPEEHCRCGIYALKNPVEAILNESSKFAITVLGQVELTGKVIEGTGGYRAEKARILDLLLFPARSCWRCEEGLDETTPVYISEMFSITICSKCYNAYRVLKTQDPAIDNVIRQGRFLSESMSDVRKRLSSTYQVSTTITDPETELRRLDSNAGTN